jgi:type I restriction enzyme, S subunit
VEALKAHKKACSSFSPAKAKPSPASASPNSATRRSGTILRVQLPALLLLIADDCLLPTSRGSTPGCLSAAETEKLAALKTHKQGLMQQLFPSPEAV